jgi:hypothetical protein
VLTYIITILIEREPTLPEIPPRPFSIESDDDGSAAFTGSNLFIDREGGQIINSVPRHRRPAAFQDEDASDESDAEVPSSAPNCLFRNSHTRDTPDLANLSNLHNASLDTSSSRDVLASNLIMADSYNTSNDGEDAYYRLWDTSITGAVRIVYEKAKAELAYKVLYEQPFPDHEETRHLLTDV